MPTPAAFPKVAQKAWQVLRARASAAPSTKFTPATVAALLDMSSPKSAGDNVVYPLRRLGLLDEDDALSERGTKWRNDASYAEACQEILDEIYPEDLSALTTDNGDPDKTRITTWFEHRGFGGSNARQMAATYALIAAKVPPEPPGQAEPRREPTKKTTSAPRAKQPTVTPTTEHHSGNQHETPRQLKPDASGPVVHLDIQIHIPADASVDQIDQIFASMAKHLYGR